jgi:MoaA/NifB/PqqE/SkfB family radical SAM enzyme
MNGDFPKEKDKIMFTPRFDLEKMLKNISYEPQLTLLAQMTKDEENGEFVDRRRFCINNKWYLLVDSAKAKIVIGEDYNYIFIKKTGFFQRWGKTGDDDPLFSPLGPEILDLEISVDGCSQNCPFCYKGNTNQTPTNMTLDTFKTIISKMPRVLTQIAFGITDVQTNPDFIPMMELCRSIGIIPNFTLSGIDLNDEIAKKVSEICGAVAVSVYDTNKHIGYDAIEQFTSLGMDQVNIHIMVSNETLPFVYEVLGDIQKDSRLKNMNAVVFLGVKPKGRAKAGFESLSNEQYSDLVNYCLDNKLDFGFDSCSAPRFENAIKISDMSDDRKIQLLGCSEPCESSIFSSYINVIGEYWHCSFTEDETGYDCINVLETDDFLKDVWYSEPVLKFRKALIDNMVDDCRYCQVFPSINK